MSSYDWYNIFNYTEFDESGLTSQKITVNLEDRGEKEIIITKGNHVGVLFDDVFLPIELNDRNPFVFESRAVYIDADNEVWVGVLL